MLVQSCRLNLNILIQATSLNQRTAQEIRDKSNSYYILSYCSPKRKLNHTLTLQLKGMTGELKFSFTADNFTGGCDSKKINETGLIPADL